MRGHAVLKGLQHEAEALPGHVVRQADELEHALLHLAGVDADGAGAHLDAVEHQVVGLGADLAGLGLHLVQVLVHGRGEGMVHGDVAPLLLVVLQERELRDPEQVVLVLVDEVELLGQLQAQRAQGLQDHAGLVRDEEERVAGLGVQGLEDLVHLRLGEELGDWRLHGAALLHLDPSQTLGLEGLDEFAQRVDLLAADLRGKALGVDAAHGAAVLHRAREHGEAAAAHRVRDVVDRQAEPAVRLVGAVGVHGVLPGDALQGELKLDALDRAEHLFKRALDHGLHVLRLDKAHLDVALGELRLAVGAAVLVAEAAGDLEIAVVPAEHEQLLVDLRALRQGVEGPVVQAGGHQEVARALGRGLGQ